ncbi:major facilitator superfamily domain-containing protein [Talaromyces proteolyticus]|uniref:Major facilitator superfamily domain-containing protein n=1 Tax=Talaromyces proteolyticus TaxID=1131652 RepID=A0AAD4KRI9_9EURO|nr:major facilitator superfamily domain-containing protein [Talaromyces proteolyticus]KAH8694007.1 major facilitator superfamily domain-containing protein [Talaromyces proteolyticus]
MSPGQAQNIPVSPEGLYEHNGGDGVQHHEQTGRRKSGTTAAQSDDKSDNKQSSISELIKFLFPFFVSLNTKGLNLAFGAFLYGYKDIQVDSSVSYLSVSWIGSIYASVLLLLFPLVKWMFDQLKPKKDKHRGYVLVVGALCITIRTAFLIASASVSSYEGLIIMHGCVVGVMDSVLYGLAVIYLDANQRKRPLMWTGFIRLGASIGGVVHTAILNGCLPTIGFPWGIRICAILGVATMLPTIAFLPPLEPVYAEKDLSWSWSRLLIFEDIVGEKEFEDGTKPKNSGPSFVLALFGMLCLFGGLYYAFHFIVLYGVHSAHKTPAESMRLLIEMCACHGAGSIVASLLKGYVEDQMSVLTFAVLCTSQALFTWTGANDHAGLIMFVCFYGFYSAIVETLHLGCMFTYANSYPDADQTERMRYRTSFLFVAMGVGALAGAPATSMLIQMGGKVLMFVLADAMCATALLVAAFCLFLALVLMSRKSGEDEDD